MSGVAASIRREWPAWLCIAFIAMLPWGGRSPLPLAILALAFIPIMLGRRYRERLGVVAAFVIPLFLAYWLPIALSLPDSYDGYRTLKMTLGASRLLLAALAIGVLLHDPAVRRRVLQFTTWILLLWVIDAFWQLFTGVDLVGRELNADRLSGIFRRATAYGPTLAVLSPLALEYARRRWPPWAFAAVLAALVGGVLISGMRSSWLMMAMVVAAYVLVLWRGDEGRYRRAAVVMPLLFALVFAGAFTISPTVQKRVGQTMAATEGTFEGIDLASSYRVPIYQAAVEMYLAHPVNGVGTRAFRTAYPSFAGPSDPHVARGDPASHAHNIVLEVMADTGTIGLIGLLAGYWLAWRRWRAMPSAGRHEAFPFVLALLLIVFPFNSHWATYGSYATTLAWFLIGLWAATWPGEQPIGVAEGDPP